ncbi:MAG: 50S ribosomal protein L13 [Campylobacteraceae bacterium]|jgi:large subunit ribosomal protein L13|nr:50S ribosomal protein L13 [Campylobacteraceae bacterium]
MSVTKIVKPNDVVRNWVLIDAKGQRFGRVLTKTAILLRGKHKPSFTPNVDCGDFVVIINAALADFSGKKIDTKLYHRHSGYFGSTKSEKLGELLEKNPAKLYKIAVRGMLPKTVLGKAMLKKLKVYALGEHPHTAQFGKTEGK